MSHETNLVTPGGKRITERVLRKGLRISFLAGCMGMAGAGLARDMPLIMFMEALGASGVLIGMMNTVTQAAFMTMIPTSLFMENLKSRKLWWGWVSVLSRVVWIVPAALIVFLADQPELIARWVVISVAISAVLAFAGSASWFSWMADLVPERLRASFWGIRQSVLVAAFLISLWVAGRVLDAFPSPAKGGGSWNGFILVFVVGTILGCVDVIIHLFVPEPAVRPREKQSGWLDRILEPLRVPDFRRITLAMGIFVFACSLTSLGTVLLKKNFNVSYTELSAISIAGSVGTILAGLVWGYIMDRIGSRTAGAVSLILGPMVMLSWFFVKDYDTSLLGLVEGVRWIGPVVEALASALPASWVAGMESVVMSQCVWIILLASFFTGAIYSGVGLCQLNLTASLAPKEGKTVAMAVHFSFVGLIGAFGGVLAGQVMDYFASHPSSYVFPTGTPLVFHHVLIAAHILLLWFVVLPVLMSIRRKTGELPVSVAMTRIFLNNPIRAITNIYMMRAPVTRHKKARAVRKLGEERTAIAVSDLIEKLEDPSSDVREEAAYALGSIGNAEAVDALIRKLNDPHSDLGPQIARALRQARSPDSVDALVRKLRDPDRETRTESARALGEIGDARAVPSLMNILAESKDAKVVSASGQALAHLGEVAAIYDILPRMKETRNPVLKRSLAVAIGDLLGERDVFYKVWSKEQQARGSEVSRLMKELRRDIRGLSQESMAESGAKLVERTREIERLYEEESFVKCSEALFYLAIGLSALRWGVQFGGNSKAFVNDLIWHDQRYGVGVWYLDLLRQGWENAELGQRDYVDVLLGIYFIGCRGLKD